MAVRMGISKKKIRNNMLRAAPSFKCNVMGTAIYIYYIETQLECSFDSLAHGPQLATLISGEKQSLMTS